MDSTTVLLPGLMMLAESSALSELGGSVYRFAQIALGLGFVIFVHELGHFLAAKTFGVRCDKFYIGFDVPISIGPIKFPRTLGKFTWGETEYGIGIIPLGGYVKMLGQDDDPRAQAAENEKIRASRNVDSDEPAEIELDPRSYPAKPVWQRMIIISAGVVMNLIFAVILAGIAYGFGVQYQPSVSGRAAAGSPTWEAGIQPGDKVMRYGDMEKDEPKLRYRDFAMGVIIQGFDKESGKDVPPVDLVIENEAGERRELKVTPTNRLGSDDSVYRIGFNPSNSPVVGSKPYSQFSLLSTKEPDLQPKDRFVAVNGDKLPIDERYGAIRGFELTRRFQANYRDPVKVTIERGDKEKPETLEVELPAVPVLTPGIGFAVGKVNCIQAGSAGEAAGIEVGDTITELNGEPIADALRLPAMVADLAGEEFELKLLTKSGEEKTVQLTAPADPIFDSVAAAYGSLSLGGLGVAFDVSPEVTYVSEQSAAAGVMVGDILKQHQWLATDEEKELAKGLFTSKAFDEKKIDDQMNVAMLYAYDWQQMPEGAKLKYNFERDGKIQAVTLELAYQDDWFWSLRGVQLTEFLDTHTADSVSSAAMLGLRETRTRFGDVLRFLRLLVTGKIGAKGVGGPLAIVSAANDEASFGVSRLFLFLTLLSANLAILNFLPIPALDGGHMVFLTAEAIMGKPVNEALQIRLTMIGVLGLLCLMAFVIFNDILRMVG